MAFVDILEIFAEAQGHVPDVARVFGRGNAPVTGLYYLRTSFAHYNENKRSGCCVKCAKPTQDGSYCSTCRKVYAAYQAKSRAEAAADGTCRCGATPEPGKKFCTTCLERARVYAKNRYRPKERRPKATPEQRTAWDRQHRAAMKAAGKCARCPNAAKPGRTRCEACTAKEREARALRNR